MGALSAGHLATDFANGALPALLPFLVDRFDLSYTRAGLLMLASAVSSSVVQPAFGVLSDRRGAVWLLPAGVAVCGAIYQWVERERRMGNEKTFEAFDDGVPS